MRKSVENRIAAMRLEKRSMSIWHRAVLVLICAVVAVTTYTLVLPAITMEGDFICGKEVHVHTEDCYTLQPDGSKVLTCGMEEHVHDETCLVHADSTEDAFTCGYDYEHIHGDECYLNGQLICTLSEHTHTEDCLPQVRRASAAPEDVTEPVTEQASVTETAAQTAQEQPTQPSEAKTEAPAVTEPKQEPTAGEQATEKTTEQATEQTTEEPHSEQPTEDTTEQPSELPTQEPTDAPTEQPTGEDQPTELPSDQPTQPASEQPSGEEPTEQITGELLTEQAKDDLLRGTMTDAELAAYSDEKDKIIDINTLRDTYATFVIKKGNQEIQPELTAAGRSYSFQLEIDTSDFNMYSPPVQEIYSYIVDTKGMTLRLEDPNASAFLMKDAEELAADFIKVQADSAAWMKVVRLADGTYQFLFKSIGSLVSHILVSGEAVSSRRVQEMAIAKESSFNPGAFTYDYTVDAYIPGAVDSYDQYYRIDDYTTVTASGDSSTTFNGFSSNLDTLQVFISQDEGNTFTPLKPIDEAVNDDSVDMAYYIDYPGGNMGKAVVYLYNRTSQTVAHPVTAPKDYPGWDIYWEQSEDSIVRFTYTDNKSKELYDANSRIVNVARLWNQDQNVNAGEGLEARDDVNYSNMIGKTGSPVVGSATPTLEYTVTVNNNPKAEQRPDMGDTPLEIRDTVVSNGKIVPGSFRVFRMSDNTEISESPDGYQVALADDARSFVVTLYNPGSSPFKIVYRMEQEDPNNNVNMNRAVIANSGDSRMAVQVNADYDKTGSEWTAKNYGIRVQLTKKYECDNPPKGARFGLYEANDDKLIAISATEAGGGQNDQSSVHTQRTCFTYYDGEWTPVTYAPYAHSGSDGSDGSDGSEDIIVFSTAVGMKFNKVYYVKEIEAPEGYVTLEDRIYFYACNPNPAKANVVPSKATELIEQGVTVYRLDDWAVVTNETGISEDRIDHDFTDEVGVKHNPLIPVELPETGGAGLALPISQFGFGTVCAVLIVVLQKKRRGGVD